MRLIQSITRKKSNIKHFPQYHFIFIPQKFYSLWKSNIQTCVLKVYLSHLNGNLNENFPLNCVGKFLKIKQT
jgi:hypothetical protein